MHVVDGVVAGVGTEPGHHAGIVVADSAHVELLGPVAGGVHGCEVVEHRAAELVQFLRIGSLAVESVAEDLVHLLLGVVGGVECLKTMVGETAAHRGEEVVAALKGLQEVIVGADLHTGRCPEGPDIFDISLGILNGHGLVRPPGRQDLHTEGLVHDGLVILQGVGGIIGGADHLHVETLHQALGTELLRG